MKQDNLKPKLAPSISALQEKQEATERLLKLSDWAEAPNEPPATIEPLHSMLSRPRWGNPAAEKVHAYNIHLPESLFQKIDFVWKRKDKKSMREWVLQALEKSVEDSLKDLGVT